MDARAPACDPFTPAGPGRAFLVAEIGNNHEGDFEAARQLVREAARAGADAVKFQTFRTEHFVHPSDAARVARLKRFELPAKAFGELADEARRCGILFLSTPLDLPSVDVLEPLVWAYKIASGDNDCAPIIERAARKGRPLIISTGISALPTVARAVSLARGAWAAEGMQGKLALLHCVSAYPAPLDEVNLRSILTLQHHFPDVSVGYSDHAMGIEASLTAAALGARIIEKHFTLDHHRSDFRDHQLSADPAELRQLADGLSRIARMLGEPGKTVQPSEAGNDPAIRRSLFLARDVPAGRSLTMDDLAFLRPGGGVASWRTPEVLGRAAKRALRAGDRLELEDLEVR